jgi:hypothetical protein
VKKRELTSKPKLYIKQIYEKSEGVNQLECHNHSVPFVTCGKIYQPVLPLQLSKKDPSIKLAQLAINTETITQPCVLVNFSCFITSILREERFNSLLFRLTRTCADSLTADTLEEWPFRRQFVNDTNIKEPFVVNFCDCFNTQHSKSCTYTFELAEVMLSEQSSYNITQKSMTAQVYPA